MCKIFVIISLSLLLFSCSEDFNVNGPWKDITIVYGLLSQTDSVQYIKVNKAFLGDGNAWEMAKEADSIQYLNAIDVSLIEFKLKSNSYNPAIAQSWETTGRTIQLNRTNEIPKSDTSLDGSQGTFGNQVNYLYKTNEKLSEGKKYKLQIVVPGKADTISSEAFIIYDLNVYNPIPDVGMSKTLIDIADSVKPYTTVWELAVYGKVYQCRVRFNYIEIVGNDTSWHYIDTYYPTLVAQNIRIPSTQSTSKLSQVIGGPDFLRKVGNSILVKEGVKRKAISLDFYYMVAGENYYTYRNISSSQSGFGQDKTNYSNLINGKGFFDARYIYTIKGKQLKGSAHDELANGNYTKLLNFADGHGVWKK